MSAVGPGVLPPDEREFAFDERDFKLVRRLIYEYAGIKLSEQKRSMVYNRLSRRLRAAGVQSFTQYLDRVQLPGAPEREGFVNALTTNLTAFFREPHHFELLAEHAKAVRGPLQVWSSACSTGEEAWSAAMILREAGRSGEILATDIDSEVLRTARDGVYQTERIEHLDPARLRSHFLRGTGANAGLVSVRPELRAMVKFSHRNLQAQWPAHERFDAIFCRNVVIYFDSATQKRLLEQFAAILAPGGLLLVGHAESFPAGHPAFRPSGRTAYVRRAD
jgi:chemotaxis protein methyltransferase CheR